MAKKAAPKHDKLAMGRAIHAATLKVRKNIADATVARHIRPLRRDLTAAVVRIKSLEAAYEELLRLRVLVRDAYATRLKALEDRMTAVEDRRTALAEKFTELGAEEELGVSDQRKLAGDKEVPF